MNPSVAVDFLKERQFLRRLHGGDASAFAEAYDLYAPKIYRHALYRTSSHETAEDIMGQTFLKAWEYISERSGEVTHLKAFLYRIANNLVVDHYRSRSRTDVGMTETIERLLESEERTDDVVEYRLELERMHASLDGLKEETRDLLIMRYIDELSIDEIADLKGKKKNAVYVALHRAVKELKHVCSNGLTENSNA